MALNLPQFKYNLKHEHWKELKFQLRMHWVNKKGHIKVKLSPKCNLAFIYEYIWIKPLCKSIITTKEALLRFTMVSFSGKLIFNGVLEWTLFVCTEFTKRKVYELLMSAAVFSAHHHHGRQTVSIPGWDLIVRLEEWSTTTLLHVGSHSGIDTFFKFHVVSSFLSVLKIATLMLAYECPSTPLKISLPENETTVNLKSASFVIITLLHKGLTHIHS